MISNAEIFLERIEEIFGTDYTILRFDARDNGTPIHLFCYKDIGMMTSITYGLSEGNHSEWVGSKPELIDK